MQHLLPSYPESNGSMINTNGSVVSYVPVMMDSTQTPINTMLSPATASLETAASLTFSNVVPLSPEAQVAAHLVDDLVA